MHLVLPQAPLACTSISFVLSLRCPPHTLHLRAPRPASGTLRVVATLFALLQHPRPNTSTQNTKPQTLLGCRTAQVGIRPFAPRPKPPNANCRLGVESESTSGSSLTTADRSPTLRGLSSSLACLSHPKKERHASKQTRCDHELHSPPPPGGGASEEVYDERADGRGSNAGREGSNLHTALHQRVSTREHAESALQQAQQVQQAQQAARAVRVTVQRARSYRVEGLGLRVWDLDFRA